MAKYFWAGHRPSDLFAKYFWAGCRPSKKIAEYFWASRLQAEQNFHDGAARGGEGRYRAVQAGMGWYGAVRGGTRLGLLSPLILPLGGTQAPWNNNKNNNKEKMNISVLEAVPPPSL